MTTSGFEAFADAVSASRPDSAVDAPMHFGRACVLGGAADARMLAALCLAEGVEVVLFSAYGKELGALRAAGGITLRGDGPIGTFATDRADAPAIRTTAELDAAVSDADVIFLTGPVHKQRTYAMVLADHLKDGQALVLAPGRTFGAAEAAWLLRVGGCRADVTLIEVQGLPYWCASGDGGGALQLSAAAPVTASTLPAGRSGFVAALRRLLPNIIESVNTTHSSFADGSGLVEIPALLLGGPAVGDGMPPLPPGGVALPENRSFRALIGPEHKAVIAALAAERTDVAQAFGVRDLPGADPWIDRYAGDPDRSGARAVPSHRDAQAIVRCATVGSLVPLASAGEAAGRETPVTDAMIALASVVLDADVASAGRRLAALGIQAGQQAGGADSVRRALDAVAQGRGR